MAEIVRISYPEGHQLSFWEVEKESEELYAALPLTSEDQEEYSKLNHAKRIQEWLASRGALRVGLNISAPVLYHANGKPYLEKQALSFSHCLPVAGALVHPRIAGMDIQSPDPKIEKIRNKFGHEEELAAASENSRSLDYLTLLWSAKEAIFKVYGENFIFAEQIRINPFQPGQNKIEAKAQVGGNWIHHELRCFKVKGNWVVVVVK